MKRQRALQIVVGLLGLLYVALTYFLYTDLLHSAWLLVHKNDTNPMFLSFYIALGFFLLLAARKPVEYRPLIIFAAWQSLAHSAVMAVQTVETYVHGVPRNYADVIITAIIGVGLLLLVPARTKPIAAVGVLSTQ